jgi:nickel-type superoxide dismutase maturation protease
MLRVIKVKGHSMVPRLMDEDYVLVNRWTRTLKVGQLVVVNHPLFSYMVKKVLDISPDGQLWLGGENKKSLRPEQMGWVQPCRIIGKVVYCICASRNNI